MNAPISRPPSPAEAALAAQFAALDQIVRDHDREQAFARFSQSGLPTRRVEAWHYTDLRAAMADAAPIAPKPDADRIAAARAQLTKRERLGDVRLVLLDGRFVPELSNSAPNGLIASILVMSPALAQPDAVVALNDAFAQGGLSLLVDAGVKLAERVEIAHCVSGDASQAIYSRVLITLIEGASVLIIESFVGASSTCQRNALTRLNLNAGARCEIVGLIDDDAGLHLESQIVMLGAGAEFNAFALVCGGALTRRQIFATLKGEGGRIALGGLSLVDGKRHADTTLEVVHAAPAGESREFYRSIVADEAVGVFQGKVIVRPVAQKTDGAMKSQAILLSPLAQMHAKPELEIFADDVVCGHGATVGALDPEQVFYLQSRGLPKREAEAMLLEAFGGEAIDRVGEAGVAAALRARLAAWLAAREGAP